MNEEIMKLENEVVRIFNASKAPTEVKRLVLQNSLYQIELAKLQIPKSENGGSNVEQST